MRKTMAIGMTVLLVLTILAALTPAVGAEEYECPACGNSVLYGQEECDECGEGLEWDDVEATIDIDPDTLNLKSKGKWITCYIELPDGFDENEIDVSSVTIGYTGFEVGGEYGEFQTTCMMVKFDRSDVEDMIGSPGSPIELVVEGQLTDGTQFTGSDSLKIISP